MLINQFIVNGLITGAIISLVATGFSLIYATNRFVHFGHGSVVAFGAYMLYLFFTVLHVPFAAASVAAVLLTGLGGALMYRLVYVPLKKRKASSAVLLIASLALMILLENILLAAFGPGVKSIGLITTQKGMTVLGAIITPLQIITVASSLVLLATVWIFIRFSATGTLMRAVSDNPELASISGINVARVQYFGFFAASLLAGAGSILIGLEQNVTPFMGTNLILKGFAGAVVGGMYSLPGAVLGSFLLGMSENLGTMILPSAYREAITFTILFMFLLFRPQGILGVRRQK